MSMLAALKGCYDRLAEDDTSGIAPFGYKVEQISFAVRMTPDGAFIDLVDLRDEAGSRRRARRMLVPLGERTSGIEPRFLWDNSSYLLGISERSKRTSNEHEKFVNLQDEIIGGHTDPGLRAVILFLHKWNPEDFENRGLNKETVDTNLIFHLDGDLMFIHERPAAKELWLAHLAKQSPGREMMCLITGKTAPVALTHPKIRNLGGPQADTAIVSFNQDAFTSYGKKQNENAPVSEEAAFAYTTALNHLLRPNRVDDKGRPQYRNRVQIADASTVFWAERPNAAQAMAAEALFSAMIDPPSEPGRGSSGDTQVDPQETAKIRDVLMKIAKGHPLEDVAGDLASEIELDTRFYILGLAPNAARISVRFWHQDTLGKLAERFRAHWQDLAIDPSPWRTAPAVWALLYETSVPRTVENIPAHLAGEVMRAILTGGRYPRSLLANVLMRMRSDRDERDPRTNRVRWRAVNGLRAAICKACLNRDARLSGRKEDVPVSLDKSDLNPGYRLGRLFAVLEAAQVAALGNLNASIRDRYYGAAAATPTSVFPLLMKNYKNHLKNVRTKKGERLANWYEKRVGEIVDDLPRVFPRSLSLEDQGRFAIGYYQEREGVYRKKDPEAPDELKDADQSDTPEDEE
jgi:CRISPR-associated protein Csd1